MNDLLCFTLIEYHDPLAKNSTQNDTNLTNLVKSSESRRVRGGPKRFRSGAPSLFYRTAVTL